MNLLLPSFALFHFFYPIRFFPTLWTRYMEFPWWSSVAIRLRNTNPNVAAMFLSTPIHQLQQWLRHVNVLFVYFDWSVFNLTSSFFLSEHNIIFSFRICYDLSVTFRIPYACKVAYYSLSVWLTINEPRKKLCFYTHTHNL